MATHTYTPGVCNIGQAEIRQRNRVGLFGLILTIVVWGSLWYGNAPGLIRLVVALPAMIAAVGYIQAYRHFCAAFGLKGIFNLDKSVGQTDTVQQAEFRAQDRRTAITIFLTSIALGVAVGALAYLTA